MLRLSPAELGTLLQVGIIDTGVSIHHQDLTANTQKSCEDFVNGDGSCDEGSIAGPSKVHAGASSVTRLRQHVGDTDGLQALSSGRNVTAAQPAGSCSS